MVRPGTARSSSLSLVLALSVLAPVLPASAGEPPPNDDRASAHVVRPAEGRYEDVVEVADATREVFDPDCGPSHGNNVWYSVEGTGNVVALDVGGSDAEATIGVLQDGDLTNCQTGSLFLQTEVGQTYLVVVTGTDGALRTVVQDLPEFDPGDGGGGTGGGGEEPPPPPPAPPANDDLATATAIGSLPYTSEPVDTTGATSDGSEPGFCGNQYSVWFTWTPEQDVHVAMDTLASDYDTVLGVYRSTPDGLGQVACNDDAAGTTQSRLEMDARAGTTYSVLVSARFRFDRAVPGMLVLRVEQLTKLGITVEVLPDALLHRSGVTYVDVLLRCSRPAQAGVSLAVRQGPTGHETYGHGTGFAGACGTEPVRKRVEVFPDTPGALRPGPAQVTAVAHAVDQEVRAEAPGAGGVLVRRQ